MKAELHIEALAKNGSTFLKKGYFTPPLKIADITEDRKQGRLHLMLMSSSPGILDEDEYKLNITLHENADLALYTQSYQRLFTMQKSARQHLHVHMAENASFCYLPHPVVPHRASDFRSQTRLNLSQGCVLVWGEVLTCGRKLNGEIFNFTRYHSTTEVSISGKLVIRENLLLQPLLSDVTGLVQMHGYTHQASLIYLDKNAVVKNISHKVNDYLNMQQDMLAGVSLAPVNGIIVRILGNKAEQLHDCLKTITANILNTGNIMKSPGRQLI